MTIIDRRYSVAEGTAVKAPCRVATTANISLTGLQTIDGVALVADERVLVKNQSTGSQNGIYTASTGNWQRTRDFDGAYDIVTGTRVFVTAGTLNNGSEFYVSTTGNITIDSTSITFSPMPAGLIAASVASASASAASASASASAAAISAAAAIGLSTALGHGIVGDGVADDRAAIQATIDAVAASGGGYVHCAPGATYRVVISNSVTNFGLIIKSGVTLLINEAIINFECVNAGTFGFRLQSDAHLMGPGAVNTTVSTSPGGSGWYHAPVFIGAAYGDVTDVNNLGLFINASNWSVRNLTLTSVRSGVGGYLLAGCGGMSHGLVENITIPDNSNMSVAIGFDHGTVGNLGQNIPANRVLFDAGTAYSVFPHDIIIRRINIGRMSKTVLADDGGMGVRLSGCYKITIEDVEVRQSTYAGFFHTAGDFGFEFAPTSPEQLGRRWGRGVNVKNYHVYEATQGYGFFLDNYADNIAGAVALGYVSLRPTIGYADFVFENCRTWSTSGSAANPGFGIFNVIGGTLRNCFAMLHSYGARIASGADWIRIEGGSYTYSYKDSILVGDTDRPEDITIVGAKCYAGGQDPGVTKYAGVLLAGTKRARIEGCVLGEFAGESTQDYGVNVTSDTIDAELVGNHIESVATSGTGLVLAGATDYGVVSLVKDNYFGTGISTKISGLNIIPIESIQSPYGAYRRFVTSRVSVFSATPSAGTWVQGDTVEFVDPTSGGSKGSTCTASGSPGTWKNYGVIS